VTTSDGYILSLFRVGKDLSEAGLKDKQPVFLQHGILDSSDTWVMNKEKSPALQLVNEGFDVWLGNTRGNKYSRDHSELDPDNKEDTEKYFNFSFEEIGLYDYKANVEYILKQTGKEKLSIIAHSQGTTSLFFALIQDLPYYKSKLNHFIALAPVTKLANPPKILQQLASSDLLISTLKKLGINEVFPENYLSSSIFSTLCGLIPSLCHMSLTQISDSDASISDEAQLAEWLNQYPSGASFKCVEHFSQLIQSNKFQRFDFGDKKNLEIYQSHTPAEIDLKKLNSKDGVKISLFSGESDLLSHPKDVEWTYE
jgi:lysosomal acid lipase/cholesteryl ester hydrolase